MIASKAGHVVNIASLAGHAGTNKLVCICLLLHHRRDHRHRHHHHRHHHHHHHQSHLQVDYCSSKFAAVGLDEAFRVELAVQVQFSFLTLLYHENHYCRHHHHHHLYHHHYHQNHCNPEDQSQGHSDYIKTTVVCPYYISTGMFAGVYVIFIISHQHHHSSSSRYPHQHVFWSSCNASQSHVMQSKTFQSQSKINNKSSEIIKKSTHRARSSRSWSLNMLLTRRWQDASQTGLVMIRKDDAR